MTHVPVALKSRSERAVPQGVLPSAALPVAQPCWIETSHGCTAASWFWPLGGAPVRTAVVIVSGIAHEERTMSGGVVALAESLAGAGLAALQFDLNATANSSGKLGEGDARALWRRDIRAALAHVREAGFSRVALVGVRLGAMLALDALAGHSIDGMVAWAPVTSGRRHVRELRVLQSTGRASAAGEEKGRGKCISVGAFDLPPSVVDVLAQLDAARCGKPPASRMLVLEQPATLSPQWLQALADHGTVPEIAAPVQTEAWLFGADDNPMLPHVDIETITCWCAGLEPAATEDTAPLVKIPEMKTRISFSHRGHRIRETVVEIGPAGLRGILSEPMGRRAPGAVRLLMSTVGPGRTFTDLARDEASQGHVSLRFDFAGFGASRKSPGSASGALYTDDGCSDVRDAVEHLRHGGHRHMVAIGFCAGAWSMLQAGALPGVDAVVAINVALYRQPDAPPFKKPELGPAGIVRWLAQSQRGRLLNRVASRLSRMTPARSEPVRWVEELCKQGAEVMLAYADPDPGYAYLRSQLVRGLRAPFRGGRLVVAAYEGLGHLGEGALARQRMLDDVRSFVGRIDHRLAAADQASEFAPGSQAQRPMAKGHVAPWLAGGHGLSRY